MLFSGIQSSSFMRKGPVPTGWREKPDPYISTASRGTIDSWNWASFQRKLYRGSRSVISKV